ncbi:MAG: NAD-dependent epimerase/dehydratase family protein, partial [Pirellulales bacterium]
MAKQRIVVTGAAGMLGSAIVVDLARDHLVEAIDWRTPGQLLVEAAPQVGWHQADIGDRQDLEGALRQAKRRLGSVDVVLHFAAYYHFGADWRSEYERTNIEGVTNIVRLATQIGVERLIFASSTMATLPPSPGAAVSERTAADSRFPYGRSKAMGEQIVRENSERLPAIVLRIGGVFSDWCELPPLTSLIRLWR